MSCDKNDVSLNHLQFEELANEADVSKRSTPCFCLPTRELFPKFLLLFFLCEEKRGGKDGRERGRGERERREGGERGREKGKD